MEGIISGLVYGFELLGVILLLVVVVPITGLITWKLISKLLFKQELEKKLQQQDNVFLRIKISPSNGQKEEAIEAFLKSIHRLLPAGAYLSLEMVSSEQFMTFYIVLSKSYKKIVESQLYAQFTDAEIEESKDYFLAMGNAAIVEFAFKKSSIYSFNTYKNIEEDLLKNLSAALSQTEDQEKVYIQLVLKRTGSKIWERGLTEFFYKITAGNRQGKETKIGGDIYFGKLRIAYIADDKNTAKVKLSTIANLFKVVKGLDNEFKKGKSDDGLLKLYSARMLENEDYWSIPEIATIYHFPYKGAIVSNVVNSTAKRAPAPDILPTEVQATTKAVSFFGETNYRNEKKKFGIKRIDRRRHVYVVGKTGSGKSRLLELLLISDIQQGEGCCLLDPHGDLATELLLYIRLVAK